MTFLNPLVLFGLVAAAIPLILHLLNLRKLRTIEFSTLAFLKELQQTKIRRLKLRQLLLLIVRTLLLIFIILAFARPALRGSFLPGFGAQAHSTVVFILDDSFSMTAGDEHGEYFKQAKESAGRLIDLLKDGDEAFLLRLSDLPKATIDPAIHDFGALRTVIAESPVSPVRRPMRDALQAAARLLLKSRNANREVYIISDMQRTLFADQAGPADSSLASAFDERIKVFMVAIGSRSVPNSAVDSVEVKTKILEAGRPTEVYTSVRNFNPAPLRDDVVSIFLDGARAAQGSVTSEPFGSSSVQLEVTPKRTGFIKGYIELEADALEADNRRYFTLHVPEQVNVTMVAPSSHDIQYLLLAARAGQGEGSHVFLNLQQLTPDRIPFLDLKNTDVLVFANVASFSGADAGRIAGFVRQGGGVILFPGPGVETGNYNATILPALGIPPVENLLSAGPNQAAASFQKIDADHPIFETLFEEEGDRGKPARAAIESPAIRSSLNRQAGKHGQTIIGLTTGNPFLTDHSVGDGKVLFYSVPPTLDWSDLPLKGIFAPLFYRSLIYVSSRGEVLRPSTAGEEVSLKIQKAPAAPQFTLVSPDGTEEFIQTESGSPAHSATSSVSLVPKRLTQPGFYEVRNGKSVLTVAAVNIDPLESDTRKAGAEEIERFWKRTGIPLSSIRSAGVQDQLQSAILQSRFGIELWKYCIALALAMALLEMFIARDSRKAMQHGTA